MKCNLIGLNKELVMTTSLMFYIVLYIFVCKYLVQIGLIIIMRT